MRTYSERFFERLEGGSQRSARAIVPLVVELLRPASVVDVGCGTGAWLSAFQAAGVTDVLGIDGRWVDPAKLSISPASFRALDLEQPIDVGRGFDLAISLEVAEHLSRGAAETFVDSLARLAPAVLFSAAIPFQGGTDHKNEQWQDWWAELFARRGLRAIDCIRPSVWRDPEVEVWYAQNTLLYARSEIIESRVMLAKAFDRTEHGRLSIIHPRSVRRMSTTYARKTLSLSRFVGWRMKGLLRPDYRLEKEYEREKEFAPPDSGTRPGKVPGRGT